jgi:hypothetical protein
VPPATAGGEATQLAVGGGGGTVGIAHVAVVSPTHANCEQVICAPASATPFLCATIGGVQTSGTAGLPVTKAVTPEVSQWPPLRVEAAGSANWALHVTAATTGTVQVAVVPDQPAVVHDCVCAPAGACW